MRIRMQQDYHDTEKRLMMEEKELQIQFSRTEQQLKHQTTKN